MFRTILVPLDGSALAARALPFAGRVARAAGAELVLFRASPEGDVPPTRGEVGGERRTSATKASSEKAADLTAAAERLRREGVSATTWIGSGPAAASILAAVREIGVDLIVMSTHGRSGLGRWIYGSVADEVMRLATVPLLLVPAAADGSWPEGRSLRVLVPLDGSDLARAVLPPTRAVAHALGAEMLLLRVVVPISHAYADSYVFLECDPEEDQAEAARALEAEAEALRSEGRCVGVRTIMGGPVSSIANVARQWEADVIAMATHGSGGIVRLMMGSVATGVLHRAHVPILIVRPATQKAARAENDRDASETSATR